MPNFMLTFNAFLEISEITDCNNKCVCSKQVKSCYLHQLRQWHGSFKSIETETQDESVIDNQDNHFSMEVCLNLCPVLISHAKPFKESREDHPGPASSIISHQSKTLHRLLSHPWELEKYVLKNIFFVFKIFLLSILHPIGRDLPADHNPPSQAWPRMQNHGGSSTSLLLSFGRTKLEFHI